MDATILFFLSLGITLTLFIGLFLFIRKQFEQLNNAKNNEKDKETEILTKWLENMQSTMDTRLKGVQSELGKTTETLNKQASETTKIMNDRLEHATQVISKVQKELGSMSEIGRSMKDLQDFLKAPKLRGNIGEQVLKELLEQMLPKDTFKLQHTFKSGDRVDALLKVEEGYISVDSKFPLENFNYMMKAETEETRETFKKAFIKDVKKHINDIQKKYIRPDEGTLDFALMYIPSEAIYYEIVVNTPELGKYSWSKKVLAVSPNVFYSYLKAILIGLEGKKIESRAKEILSTIRAIKVDSDKFSNSLRILTKHISNAKNMADDVTNNFERLDNKIRTLNQMNELTPDKNETIEAETKELLS